MTMKTYPLLKGQTIKVEDISCHHCGVVQPLPLVLAWGQFTCPECLSIHHPETFEGLVLAVEILTRKRKE